MNCSRSSEDRVQNLELDVKTLDESDLEEIKREQAIEIANLLLQLDNEPAVDSSLHTTTVQAPDQSLDLDDSDIAAIELLETKDALNEPEQPLVERHRDLYYTIKGWGQNADIRAKAKSDEWDKLADAARARIHAPERQAKAEARRVRDNERRQVERAGQITAKRIAALDHACAKHRSNHFLVNMAGRSIELAEFREALTEARRQHGPKASLTQIAAVASVSKDQARRRLKDVEKLEAPRGAWYRLRNH